MTTLDNPRPHIISMSRAYLEILRGIAEHRLRRISSPVFLIGSASDCDLVMGDPAFPEIHSYLLVNGEEDGTEVVFHRVAGPLVSVNDEPIESSVVADGSIIRIDGYLLQLHLDGSATKVLRKHRMSQVPRPAGDHSNAPHDLRIFRDSA